MKVSKRHFTDSLSYTLAKKCVLVTLIVGFLLSFIQIAVDFNREQDAVEQFASEILAANQFAAADATYHLDTPAAEEVAKGILQYRAITSVAITNEFNQILAQLDAKPLEGSQFSRKHELFGDIKTFSQTLYLKSGDIIGYLTIDIDPILASEGFFDRSLLVLVSGLVRNILLTIILIFVFYLTTTKKVIAIGRSLGDLDFDNPAKSRIPQNDAKPKNELDDLSDSINSMLDVISSDIEEREQREQDLFASQKELAYQANHDLLSGLVNRRGIEQYLKLALESSQNDQAEHVFCYLDLDQFKIINDTCGHIAGDELLRQISHLLKQHIRSHDVLARLGGDEFGILMQHCDIDNAQQIAQKLIDNINRHQFVWENRPFSVAVSIGIAPITDAIKNSTDLLRIADTACYAAKDAGRNCFKVYQEDVLDIAKVHGDMEWVTQINQALEANSFSLFGQKNST